jgi:hypothetical protein
MTYCRRYLLLLPAEISTEQIFPVQGIGFRLSHHSVGLEIWILFVRYEINHLSDQEIPPFPICKSVNSRLFKADDSNMPPLIAEKWSLPFDKRPRHITRKKSFDYRNRSLTWNWSSRSVRPDWRSGIESNY